MAMAAKSEERGEGGLLDVGDLCRMFEESEDSTYEARKNSERDRDYYDNKQLTADELAELSKRGQPPVIDNIIKTKIDYLDGVEKQQRIDPKAFPRTPKHEADADGATEALRYVADEQDYDKKRSAVWQNMLIEGAGGISVSVKEDMQIEIRQVPWDRLFFDPHSSKADFSDAGYLGIVTWMDYDEALALYPDKQDMLDATLDTAPSDTYDDKPKFSHWADKKRKRVRVCQVWVKRSEQWYFAEYTKGGILKAGPSPYKNDRGESDCELFFQSAYVDRDNNRYGFVRELILLQDEVNKRRSKALHLMSTSQVIYEDGAVDDINEFHNQVNRADGKMKVNPGALADKRIEFRTRDDLAIAHFQMLQEAKNAIDLKGPNATEMGDKTKGSSAASGKAIIASQQGGMTQLAHLTDRLRDLDIRVFRAIWARVRQFWTAEKWIRITDDERNVKWVGLNIDPMQMQQMQMQMQQNPEAAEKIAGMVASVAELDCDIIIDEAPDSLTPALEQFQSLVELKKFDANNEIPFRAIVAAMPNLKDKQNFLKALDEQAEQRQGQPDPETAKAMAQLQIKQQETQQQMQLKQVESEQALAFEAQKHAQTMQFKQQEAELNAAIKINEAEHNRVVEQDKIALHHEGEQAKIAMHIHGEKQKSEMQRETHEHKLNSEKAIKTESRRDPSTEKLAEAVAKMGEKIGEGMTVMAGSIAEMGEKIAAPKKLVRDDQGNIIGSKPVERMSA
jgi:hypothetical protein